MDKMTNIEKLKAISTPAEEDWLKIAEEWEKEDLYVEKSTKIALSVLSVLREQNITKKELADKMGVSAQYVSKIVKGSENLTLETISKLENALGIELINVIDPTYVVAVNEVKTTKKSIWDKLLSAKCSVDVDQQAALAYSFFTLQTSSKLEAALS